MLRLFTAGQPYHEDTELSFDTERAVSCDASGQQAGMSQTTNLGFLECSACGGDTPLIASTTKPWPILKILAHVGEPLRGPPVATARGPSSDWGDLVDMHDEGATLNCRWAPGATSFAA